MTNAEFLALVVRDYIERHGIRGGFIPLGRRRLLAYYNTARSEMAERARLRRRYGWRGYRRHGV